MTLFPAERRLPAILADAVRYLRALSAMTHLRHPVERLQ